VTSDDSDDLRVRTEPAAPHPAHQQRGSQCQVRQLPPALDGSCMSSAAWCAAVSSFGCCRCCKRSTAAVTGWTFLFLNASPGLLEAELRRLGSQVATSPSHKKPWRLWSDFATMQRLHGPYDVVHSHVHHFSGLIVRIAACRAGLCTATTTRARPRRARPGCVSSTYAR
jgi:hypothetical protein